MYIQGRQGETKVHQLLRGPQSRESRVQQRQRGNKQGTGERGKAAITNGVPPPVETGLFETTASTGKRQADQPRPVANQQGSSQAESAWDLLENKGGKTTACHTN
jgi:hypothetical protein